MKLNRRGFLVSTLMGACSPSLFVKAGEHPIPTGILDSFEWGEREVPVSESPSPSNSVIDRAVTDAMRNYAILGCGIGVVRGDAIVYAKGFGYAELPTTTLLDQYWALGEPVPRAGGRLALPKPESPTTMRKRRVSMAHPDVADRG